MASNQDVYVGFWINWTNGRIAGATLTLQNGAYMVAFLAMFVRVTGNFAWKLLCYAAFHLLPAPHEGGEDTPRRQQQAVLRNSSSANDAVVKLGRIALRSRKTGRRSLYGPLSLSVSAAFNMVAFIAAGIFSSAVTRAQSDVLLKPSRCGSWLSARIPKPSDWDQATFVPSIDLASMIHQNLVTSSRIQLTCSESLSNSAGNCNPYGRKSIKFFSANTFCPFNSSICQDTDAISLDTGMIDSHLDLGVNAPRSDRVAFRKTLQCAPLDTKGYSGPGVGVNGSTLYTAGLNGNMTGYYYGRNRRVASEYTYAFNKNAFQSSVGTAVDKLSYQLE